MTAIIKVEYVVTSNIAAVPVDCQLGTSLPLAVVIVLLAFPHPVIYIIGFTRDTVRKIR